MVFSNRNFKIEVIETINDLAVILKIINCSQVVGFKLDKIYFFNDSADVGALQEFAVFIIEKDTWVQVDTLSVSLMSIQQLKDSILSLILGEYSFKVPVMMSVDSGGNVS